MEPVRQAARLVSSRKWEGGHRPDPRRRDHGFAAEHEARILAHILRTETEQAKRALLLSGITRIP